MRPPELTIEYNVGEKKVRRKLGDEWICPVCAGILEPAEGRPLGLSKLLSCTECGDTFRVVEVGEVQGKPKRAMKGRTPAPRSGSSQKKR